MEFMDVVDKNDEVIGKVSREEVYSRKLGHRIVHVLIFNDKGEMLLQLRAKNVEFCPLHWSTAVGGHVKSGESYEEAALRESREELGADLKIKFFSKDLYHDPRGMIKFVVVFKTNSNGPFKLEKAVEKTEFFNISKIKEMVERGEKFHPELLFLLKKYFF